jgi:hypothetical protein
MRRVSSAGVKIGIAALGCLILFGAVSAPGIAKNQQRAAVVANTSGKSDRLPLSALSKPAAAVSSPTKLSVTKRPPLGCDPMFSPIADPAHAGLYRRCAA